MTKFIELFFINGTRERELKKNYIVTNSKRCGPS